MSTNHQEPRYCLDMGYVYLQRFDFKLRTPALVSGFKEELSSKKMAVERRKVELESCYAIRIEDADFDLPTNSDHKTKCLTALRACDSAFTSLAGSIKSVKSVVDTYCLT